MQFSDIIAPWAAFPYAICGTEEEVAAQVRQITGGTMARYLWMRWAKAPS